MAVLSKIRERSLFLIIIIALALFSFVLSGLFKGNLFNKNTNNIGEVNGDPINREEFAQQVDLYRNQSNGKSSNMQYVKNAWEYFVSEKIYKTQLEKSGISVGENDVWKAIVQQVSQYGSQQFLNEAGVFDQEKLKEHIATLKENAGESEQDKIQWLNWLNFEKNVKNNLERTVYDNLIKAGIGRTLKEGEFDYFYQNTSVDVKYVFVPFADVSDSLITVSKSDIKDYIKSHPKNFKVKKSRNLKYVFFENKPTAEDEENIKKELISIINDREEYSTAAKSNVEVKGFKNASNLKEFFLENGSDTPLNQTLFFKSTLPKILADTIINKDINYVFGPYKEGGYYKLSKITDIKILPDSVKASHILIPYIGSSTADASVTQTEEEAKKVADSILKIVKTSKSKFEEIAKSTSVDKVSGAKGGDLGWFTYKTMIPVFRDFVFENKTGDFGVVKSQFGFHIIRIDGQKNTQKAYEIATFTRKIVASEQTENQVFEEAESFSSEVNSGKEFDDLTKEKGLKSVPVLHVEEFDDFVKKLGSQRQIVKWAFEEGTKENEVKRFDLENGYAIVQLTKKNKAGLALRGQNVREIVLNEKKAELIKSRTKGESLDEIAKENNTIVRTSLAISSKSPVFSGLGRYPEFAGVVTLLDENSLGKNIIGKTGVLFAKVTKKNVPEALKNYNPSRLALDQLIKSRTRQIYDAIKDNSDIVDNRAYFY